MSRSKKIFQNINKTAELEMGKRYRAAALKLLGLIIEETPVDIGTLQGNWDLNINSPSNRTYSAGRNPESQAATKSKRATIHDTIFLSNNMPYAAAIEYGLGKGNRTPVGMVRRSIQQIKRALK